MARRKGITDPLMECVVLRDSSRRLVCGEFIETILVKFFKKRPWGFEVPLTLVYTYIHPEYINKPLERNMLKKAGIVMRIDKRKSVAKFTLKGYDNYVKEKIDSLVKLAIDSLEEPKVEDVDTGGPST